MLRDRIGDQMREAMKAREPVRVGALRMLMTAVKSAEIERGHALGDEEVLEVVAREAKRRKESIEMFEKGGREELAAKEREELALLEAYLPVGLSEPELGALVDEAIAEVGASAPKDVGSVMKALMPKVKGRADGNAVSAMVRARLGA